MWHWLTSLFKYSICYLFVHLIKYSNFSITDSFTETGECGDTDGGGVVPWRCSYLWLCSKGWSCYSEHASTNSVSCMNFLHRENEYTLHVFSHLQHMYNWVLLKQLCDVSFVIVFHVQCCCSSTTIVVSITFFNEYRINLKTDLVSVKSFVWLI